MNPFFNPDDFDCEVLGFVEEFDDAETFKPLGSRRLSEPDRPCGSPGRKEYEITEPLHLLKGYRQVPVTIRASAEHPRRVIATIQVICGKKKGN